MLTIKKEQIRAFETPGFSSFREKMLLYLPVNFERQTNIIGKKGLDSIIRNGFDSARQYGLVTGYEMCTYIDLAILLGHGFDTDPLLNWAGEILTDRTVTNPSERTKSLYTKAIAFIEYVTASKSLLPERQLKKMTGFSFREFDSLEKERTTGKMAAYLESFWPEKYETASGQVNSLLRTAGYTAIKYGFSGQVATGYFTLLSFLLGHRFDTDPQYPWLADVLNDPALKGEEYRLECLQAMLKAQVELLLPGNEV